jgi:hypothetical protein
MPIDGFSTNILVGGRPRIEFDKPKASDGKWVVSGKIILEFVQGPFVPADRATFDRGRGLEIAVPFEDAADEQDAIKQAATHLQQVGQEILEGVAGLLLNEAQPARR